MNPKTLPLPKRQVETITEAFGINKEAEEKMNKEICIASLATSGSKGIEYLTEQINIEDKQIFIGTYHLGMYKRSMRKWK